MFHRMALKNFKGWESTGQLRLAPITLFFGSNSSGKTSLLQSILLLKQTAESADRRRVLHPGDRKTLVDLGTTKDLVFQHDLQRTLEFTFEWDLPGNLELGDPRPLPGKRPVANPMYNTFTRLNFSVVVGLAEERQARVERIRYWLDQMGKVELTRQQESGYEFSVTGFNLRDGERGLVSAPLKFYGIPDEARTFVDPAAWIADLGLAVEQQFERVEYVGPLREYPERWYLFAGDAPPNVGTRGEYAVHAILAAIAENRVVQVGHGSDRVALPFSGAIAQWLHDFQVIDSFRLAPMADGGREFAVKVKRRPESSEVFITDVGFGVSQVLPVLVQAYYAAPHSTVIFEQPEIHLHPRVQAQLADLFIDAAHNANVQFIIESHSEHLLRRLQRRIADETVRSDEVALYVCGVDGGRSTIEELKIDEYGNIINWPKDFFGDDLGDLVKMADAAMRRQGVEP